jgi:L-asparaginase/Glu-tRNA(Gln) amidotransferase subunit D
MAVNLDALKTISPATEAQKTLIHNCLTAQIPSFTYDKNFLALIAFGGTIQSAYVPTSENIVPVPINPAQERSIELRTFDIVSDKISSAILLVKDSRDIVDADIFGLIHLLREIPNQRVLLTCGTYLLPVVAHVLDVHFGDGKSDKIIGVTGSWLPMTQEGQDADYNLGGTTAAINAFYHAGKQGIVFAQFHGEIFTGDALRRLELHPPHVNPKFLRPYIDVRTS